MRDLLRRHAAAHRKVGRQAPGLGVGRPRRAQAREEAARLLMAVQRGQEARQCALGPGPIGLQLQRVAVEAQGVGGAMLRLGQPSELQRLPRIDDSNCRPLPDRTRLVGTTLRGQGADQGSRPRLR